MNCPKCDQPLVPGARFCAHCGSGVPQWVEGSQFRGFAVDATGGVVNIGTTTSGSQTSSAGDHCPLCGAYNPPEGTFRCRRCERSFICGKHQDPVTYWCAECVGRPSHAADSPLFHLSYQFVYPFLPVGQETLVQVLISFTSREDLSSTELPSIPTHLCLVLDVSGSMNTPEKYPLLRQAIPYLIDALSDDDYLTIILFSQGYDVLLSESIAHLRSKAQVDAVMDRVDQSGVKFGRMTLLAPSLRAALDEIAHFRTKMPLAVNRLYILTDGELHDAAECYNLNPRLRTLEVELHSYGFGHDFALDTMRHIMEDVPGGTVKPIFNTHEVKATFSHIGDLAERIVAQEAEFAFSLSRDVIAGDVFRYKPGMHYYGMHDTRTKTFSTKLGTLERDRMYMYFFEAQLRPSSQSRKEIGRAVLRYRRGHLWEETETRVVVNRTDDQWRVQTPNESALKIYRVLDAMRNGDPKAQLEALRARLSIYQHEGADPMLVMLVERSIAKLERGEVLSEDESRKLRADSWTQVGGTTHNVVAEICRDLATRWLQLGYDPTRVRWLVRMADAVEAEGIFSALEMLAMPEREALTWLLDHAGDPLERLSQDLTRILDRAVE